MSFFEEKLPSDGQNRVYFRPYTIEDAINISSMNPRLKERFTSRFLEVIQTGENRIDPRTQMTVQDRRTLLFKYALVSLEAEKLSMAEDYKISQCPLCGEQHSFRLSINDLAGQSRNRILRKDEARVYTELNGKKLAITPLTGEHAETLELLDNQLDGLKKSRGEESDQYQAKRVEKEIYRLLCQFTLAEPEDAETDREELERQTREWLYSLSASDFDRLKILIQKKQAEIEHGVSFVHYYPCPVFAEERGNNEERQANEEEGLVACRLPFRFEEFISRI